MYVPKQLWQGGKYLGGLEGFDVDFFRLLNPNEIIELRINGRSGKSYYNERIKLVLIGTKDKKSDWLTRKVIYHEYGHAIDHQRGLRQSDEIQKLVKKHRDLLLNTKVKSRDNPTQTITLAEDLAKSMEKRWWELNRLARRRGNTEQSRKEYRNEQRQLTATADTIKALTERYGWGHKDGYFAKSKNRTAEYIAHAFENAFIGNKQFKKLLPEIYDDMVDYIRQLKKVQ